MPPKEAKEELDLDEKKAQVCLLPYTSQLRVCSLFNAFSYLARDTVQHCRASVQCSRRRPFEGRHRSTHR